MSRTKTRNFSILGNCSFITFFSGLYKLLHTKVRFPYKEMIFHVGTYLPLLQIVMMLWVQKIRELLLQLLCVAVGKAMGVYSSMQLRVRHVKRAFASRARYIAHRCADNIKKNRKGCACSPCSLRIQFFFFCMLLYQLTPCILQIV